MYAIILILLSITSIASATTSTVSIGFFARPASVEATPFDWMVEGKYAIALGANHFDLKLQHERDAGNRFTDVDMKASTIINRYKLGVRYADIREHDFYMITTTAERLYGSDSLHVGFGIERSYTDRWFNDPATFARASAVSIFNVGSIIFDTRLAYSRNSSRGMFEATSQAGVDVDNGRLSFQGNYHRVQTSAGVSSSWAVKFVISRRLSS